MTYALKILYEAKQLNERHARQWEDEAITYRMGGKEEVAQKRFSYARSYRRRAEELDQAIKLLEGVNE